MFLLYFLGNLISSFICYLTNWFVVLFADEEGELPAIFKYWQTWDDSLDVDWFVKETVPSIFRYDFDSKYTRFCSSSDSLRAVNRVRMYTMLNEGASFSILERIQRYFCRTLWLYRNCGYGFSFWLFGVNVDSRDMTYRENTSEYVYGSDGKGHFIYKNDRAFCKWLRWCIFIGWKIDEGLGFHRAMIANRIAIRFKR